MPERASERPDETPEPEVLALESLVPGVRRYVRQLVRGTQEAEDATQEAFLRYLLNPSPELVRHPFEYLKRIAWNVVSAVRFREYRSREALPLFGEECQIVTEQPAQPDTLKESTDWHRDLTRALASLPPAHRTYLYFHVGQGRSREVAAKAAGLTIAAAEKAHTRALRMLAHRLRQWKPLSTSGSEATDEHDA